MGFRFIKRIKILPGFYINLGKKNMSVSIGPRGAKFTAGTAGKKVTVGIPKTGLYYTNKLDSNKKRTPLSDKSKDRSKPSDNKLNISINDNDDTHIKFPTYMVTFNGVEFDALKLTFESGLFFKTGWLSNDDTINELKRITKCGSWKAATFAMKLKENEDLKKAVLALDAQYGRDAYNNPKQIMTDQNLFDNNFEISADDLRKIKLSILINYLHSRKINTPPSPYIQEFVGCNIQQQISTAYKEEYLRKSTNNESLSYLTMPILKNLLKEAGQKVSGKKADLICRILSNIPEDNYKKYLQDYHQLTDKGFTLINEYFAYVEWFRKHSSLPYRMIYAGTVELNCTASKNDYPMLYKYLIKKSLDNDIKEKNWSNAISGYLNLYTLEKESGDSEKSLSNLLSAVSIMLSGMENNNRVSSYNHIYVYKNYIHDINQLALNLEYTNTDLIEHFTNIVSQILELLPFTYFYLPAMQVILIDAISDKWSNHISDFPKYDSYKNHPSPNSDIYSYWE